MLLNAVQLFEDNPDVLEHWRNRFQYVMVDEYQDTNPAQFRFVELLTQEHRNLCVVGDDDQSIYRFRGAEIRNILSFEKVFPEAKVIRLEQNYRSTQNILKAANGVIAHNEQRKEKTLWSAQEEGETPVFREYMDAGAEARGILQDIRREQDRFPYGDCAILYRTNAQSRVLEECFVAAGLPYRLIGGINFYERREVKDLLCYLRLIANPRDDVSLRRIVNVPKRGIGDTTLERVAEFAAREEISLLEAMSMAESIPDIKKAAAAKLTAFMNMMVGLRMEALSLSVEGMIERTLRESGYLEYLKEEGEIEAEARRENLEELVNKAADLGGEIGLEALSQFLSETSLVADVDALEEDSNRVVLMTLHSAKGLEFPKVYMAGMEQQVFPGERVSFSGDDEDLEEERRLCYVGITRAMKKLVLTAAARRMTRGEFQTHFISQFIEEIPPEVLKHENRGLMRGRFNNYDTPSAGGGRGWRGEAVTGEGDLPQPSWIDYGDSFGFGAPRRPAAARPSFTGSSAGRGWRGEAVTGEGDSSQPFSPGDRVQNRRFGAGTVEKVEALGNQLSVTVLFDKFGRKVIMAGALTRSES